MRPNFEETKVSLYLLLAQGCITIYYEDILKTKFDQPKCLPIVKNNNDLPFGIAVIDGVVWVGYQSKLVVGYTKSGEQWEVKQVIKVELPVMCLCACELSPSKQQGLVVVTQQSVHIFYPDLN